MKNKKLVLCILILFSAMLFASCSSYNEGAMDSGEYGSSTGDIIVLSDAQSKIIYYATLQIETQNFEQSVLKIKSELTAAEGYIQDFHTAKNNNKNYAEYTLRVKTENLSVFLDNISIDDKILFQTINSENATLEYYNVEAEMQAYQTEKTMLNNMIEEEMDSDIKLEYLRRITEINAKLNLYQSQLNLIDDKVEYSTVTLYLYESGSTVPRIDNYGKKITNTFTDSLNILVEILKYILLIIVALVPFAALFFALFFGIKYLLKYLKKRWPDRFVKKKKVDSYQQYYQNFISQKAAKTEEKAEEKTEEKKDKDI